MRYTVLAVLVLLAACGQVDPSQAETTEPAEAQAPPRSAGEALLTKYTWPGTGGEQAATGDWAPRDECGEIKGAYDFRIALADAVVARDEDALVALFDPDVRLDFGGGSGTATLRERLIDPPYNLWLELERALPLGCAAIEGGGFTLPWLWGQGDKIDDPFAAMFVIGSNVPAFEKADDGSTKLASLNWDMVEMVEWSDGEFSRIRLGDGREAYVANHLLRSAVDYRLLVNRDEEGNFRITTFVAGD